MQNVKSIVILTGAGISAESGLKTFRGSDGLWENHPIENVATPGAFIRNPAMVQRFYNERRRQLLSPEVAPNPAHVALARLEREFRGSLLLVTQNVDDLHERGGSTAVLHMHGELLKARCKRSGAVYSQTSDITHNDRCPCCDRSGTLRPHIVWFGEVPMKMSTIQHALPRCDLFLSIGTSGQVYPASGFVRAASAAHKIEVNPAESEHSLAFNRHIPYPASIAVPRLVDEILGGQTA